MYEIRVYDLGKYIQVNSTTEVVEPVTNIDGVKCVCSYFINTYYRNNKIEEIAFPNDGKFHSKYFTNPYRGLSFVFYLTKVLTLSGISFKLDDRLSLTTQRGLTHASYLRHRN